LHAHIQPHLREAVAERFAVWRQPHRRPGFQPGILSLHGHAVANTRAICLAKLTPIGEQSPAPLGCTAPTAQAPAASFENAHSASLADGRR
jgi:hypothetical protein